MADAQGFEIVVGYSNSKVIGAGEYYEGDIVTLRAIPDEHYTFVNWTLINSQNDEITLADGRIMTGDDRLRQHEENDNLVIGTSSVFVYDSSRGTLFEDGGKYLVFANVRRKDIFKISVDSAYGTPYVSANEVEEGESVLIRAREYSGVVFSHWSDGSVEVERTIVPKSNLNLVAIYVVVDKTISLYQYRAYVKDSVNLNALPKAFLIATSFTLREDLMSTANSTINVMAIPSGVNNGDILVLYNPKGYVMYRGVITQIEDNSIQCAQMQSFYKGLWLCQNNPTTSLENEFISLLNRYASGYVGQSPYQDQLINRKYSPVIPYAGSSTEGHLETFDAQHTMDMSSFIYELYNKYGIVLDFDIPYGTWEIGSDLGGKVKVFVPEYESIKVGDNAQCISNLTPTTEIEETNKLVIFDKNGNYRATYVATTTNGIVKNPVTDAGRFNVVNSKIVFSDDDENTIVESNLSAEMFNHYLSFDLLLNNKLYDWNQWKLGMPLQVWNGVDYYSTIYTAYELTKEENANPVSVKIECGKVRLSLTKKLLMMGVN